MPEPIKCLICDDEMTVRGGMLISAPDSDGKVTIDEVCRDCLSDDRDDELEEAMGTLVAALEDTDAGWSSTIMLDRQAAEVIVKSYAAMETAMDQMNGDD